MPSELWRVETDPSERVFCRRAVYVDHPDPTENSTHLVVAMPANLTPQYLKAEAAYRRASTPEEELECLQAMLREMPKHKGTDRLQAELKQKISKVKKELDQHHATGGKRG